MKRNFKRLVILTILVTIIFITGKVSAASVSMSLSSNSKLVEGDTVVVTLKISNIDAGDGIDSITGILNYDKNIFEEVNLNNFEGVNNWNILNYDVNEGKFTAIRSTKVNMQSDILKVTLRTKTNITDNSSSIEIKEITTGGGVNNGGTGDIKVNNVNITINKVSEINFNVDTNQQSSGQININSQINNLNEIVNNKISDNNISNTNIPQTGEEYGIVLAIAVVTVVSIIAYIRYKNINIK